LQLFQQGQKKKHSFVMTTAVWRDGLAASQAHLANRSHKANHCNRGYCSLL